MITHIVLFRLNDQTHENIAKTRSLLLSMKGRIPQLCHLEVGVDVVHTDRSYDLALVAKFASLDDLQAYQVHPYHSGEVIPYMKSVSAAHAAVDYESE